MKIYFFQIIIATILLAFTSCRQTAEKPSNATVNADTAKQEIINKPFELIVYNSDYSMAYSLQYILTEKRLDIIFKSDLEGEKDTVLYHANLKPSKALQELSNINIDSLKEKYETPGIHDGLQITVQLTKKNKTKTIQISNYYQPDIAHAIELINSMVPKKYKISYSKDIANW